MCVGELSDCHGNTVKQWEKVPNSADRNRCRTRIERNQSEASNFSQSSSPLVNQSQLRLYALTDQSQTSNPGTFCYKSRCRSQFISSVSLRTENSTIASRNTLSSVGFEWRHRSNTLVRYQRSNTPVRRRIEQQSNTPVRHPVGTYYWSNTPVRCQPSSPGSTWTNLPRSLWINSQMRRRQTRQRRLPRSTIVYAMCVAMRLWSLPVISGTCCRIIRWIWSGLLWCMTTTPTRTTTTALDLEPDSDD